MQVWTRSLGAQLVEGQGCRFRVWAPAARSVEVRITAPEERLVPLEHEGDGYWTALVAGVEAGAEYLYRLDGAKERPDPASQAQPHGLHGPSQVVTNHFDWTDNGWSGRLLEDYVIYELHVGAFTAEGTFESAISELDRLVELGVTAVELMPVAQFPGERGWGYDGVYLFAPQGSYGGVDGMKRLIDACHLRGMAVILDVVYNHLGPDGNYLWDYGPYFTERYHTPWGAAVNLDGPESDHVRRFFIENALTWFSEFHIDGLRLDAVHALIDMSARPFLGELAAATKALSIRANRHIHLIAETEQNDPRLLRAPDHGGLGLDAHWSDDFHHVVHSLLTGETNGYYADYADSNGRTPMAHLAKVLKTGYVFDGTYSPTRRRRHGASPHELPAKAHVFCIQNHDQTGNRMLGDRFSTLLSHEQRKVAAGLLLLGPYTPLLFMGEEYADPAPFLYFIDHQDPALIEAVRNGRKSEFASFAWMGEPPDPQDTETFARSKLSPKLRHKGEHKALWEWYKALIGLRTSLPALAGDKAEQTLLAWEEPRAIAWQRYAGDAEAWIVVVLDTAPLNLALPLRPGAWQRVADSGAEDWGGGGPALPATIASTGLYELNLAGPRVVVYHRAPAAVAGKPNTKETQ